MTMEASFTIAKEGKQSKCLLFNEYISKNVLYIYTIDYYFSYKMNKILLYATTWTDL